MSGEDDILFDEVYELQDVVWRYSFQQRVLIYQCSSQFFSCVSLQGLIQCDQEMHSQIDRAKFCCENDRHH